MGENPRSGSGLHSFLTSSQSHRWIESRSFRSMIFMVSSRDRNCQRIEMTREVIARAPPPAFLFPNQQCQRPEPLSRGAHRLAPDVGGGGYLSNLEFRVKPFFSKRFEPIQQNHPKAIPVDRSDLLEKAANPVKQEFFRNSYKT